jgi:hypothetical protein
MKRAIIILMLLGFTLSLSCFGEANASVLPKALSRVWWEHCDNKKICAPWPAQDKCLEANVCVRVFEENGKFFLEIEILGNRAKWELANLCVDYSIAIAKASVCITNIKFKSNGQLDSFDILVNFCIGGNVGPIHLEQCWEILRQRIQFKLSTLDVTGLENKKTNYQMIFFENENSKAVFQTEQK